MFLRCDYLLRYNGTVATNTTRGGRLGDFEWEALNAPKNKERAKVNVVSVD